jgi:hypothetical protein
MAVFWVVAPCSLVVVYRRFRECCFNCIEHTSVRRADDYKWRVGKNLEGGGLGLFEGTTRHFLKKTKKSLNQDSQ